MRSGSITAEGTPAALTDDVYRALGYSVRREHVAAVLQELERHAAVVDRRKIPDAYFTEVDGEPMVAIIPPGGGPHKKISFGAQHLSAKRAMGALREAMAILVAIRTPNPYFQKQHLHARETFLRHRLEENHIQQGGALGLADGVL